jgi:glycosyltransferase involved in cell wall biosynthesis
MSKDRIKVLFYTDPTAFQIFGGAEIQLLKTKEYLEKMNNRVYVKLFDTFNDKLNEYDILHVFQMRHDCLNICKLAKKRNLKIALSTIYEGWHPKFGTKERMSTVTKLASGIRTYYQNLKNYGLPTFRQLHPYKDFLDLADIIMPTSGMEAEFLSKKFEANPKKFYPVPIGVDTTVTEATAEFFVKKYGIENFVLFVGRIEQRKNVLTLLKAHKDIEVPLVIIGHFNLWERDYFEKCKKVAKKNVHFLGFVPKEELISAYAAAKTFVLPSWWESPGIAALEVGLAGCNIVITSVGSTREYFKDHALYVNPESADDIQRKILEALEKNKNTQLRDLLIQYTWEKTAETTLQGYKSTLQEAQS